MVIKRRDGDFDNKIRVGWLVGTSSFMYPVLFLSILLHTVALSLLACLRQVRNDVRIVKPIFSQMTNNLDCCVCVPSYHVSLSPILSTWRVTLNKFAPPPAQFIISTPNRQVEAVVVAKYFWIISTLHSKHGEFQLGSLQVRRVSSNSPGHRLQMLWRTPLLLQLRQWKPLSVHGAY